jgi:hypothetical protein
MTIMRYNDYKNISDQDFLLVRTRLTSLNSRILNLFANKLYHQSRAGESDYLILNFSIVDDGPFDSNLAIIYEDEPQKVEFLIVLVKTLDKHGRRYYKKEIIAKNIQLHVLEAKFEEYCHLAIDKYNSWSLADVEEISTPLGK